MEPRWRAVRGAVIIAGVAVTVVSLLSFRAVNWPTYVVFCLVCAVLFLPQVEALPRVLLPIPHLAATLGFLYIGGLPIIVLNNVVGVLLQAVHARLPRPWKERWPLHLEPVAIRRELFPGDTDSAELATFALGLGVRWWIVSTLVPDGPPITAPWAIGIAEVGGQLFWGLLAILPIYSKGPLLPLRSDEGLRAALADIGLVVGFALTPFVFLISYGYRTEGLTGAAAWTLSTLGLHFMLKRLHERRVTVEAQNRRLATLNRELEHRERLSAIGKMSSVVSHQILQQLGVIGVYADLIHNADGDDPARALAQARTNAGAIEGALRDVNRVLTDLLVFSKDLRVNLYEHSLADVVAECLEDCSTEAAARGVSLRTDCPSDARLLLDKLKMKQAVVNVLRNAIEASPRGGEVVIRATPGEGRIDLVVSDQGPGIPESDREAIFTPFFTTKEQGVGLGLAIARAFTDAHGGGVWVESNADGTGTRVVFRLPSTPARDSPRH